MEMIARITAHIINDNPFNLDMSQRCHAATLLSAYLFRECHDNGHTVFGATGGQRDEVQGFLQKKICGHILANINTVLHSAADAIPLPLGEEPQPYLYQDKAPSLLSPFHLIFQLMRSVYVQPISSPINLSSRAPAPMRLQGIGISLLNFSRNMSCQTAMGHSRCERVGEFRRPSGDIRGVSFFFSFVPDYGECFSICQAGFHVGFFTDSSIYFYYLFNTSNLSTGGYPDTHLANSIRQ